METDKVLPSLGSVRVHACVHVCLCVSVLGGICLRLP